MSSIIAHRGFGGMYPKNTLLAFEEAIELGVDGIKLDVHLSRDGQVIDFHDEDLERVAGPASRCRRSRRHSSGKWRCAAAAWTSGRERFALASPACILA